MTTCIVYSISYHESLDCYLPTAFICETKGGKLGYMQKVATIETISGYSITVDDTAHIKCLQLAEGLTFQNLENHFNKGKKSNATLSKILNDIQGKKIIKKKVERDLNELVGLIISNGYPLCYEVERKVLLEDIRINTDYLTLSPKLKFVKTQTGLNYELNLMHQDKKIRPYRHDVHVLSDLPAWVIIDYRLCALTDINANKLKPFLKKENVFIPDRIQKDYFEKFIKDVIGKVESEVEGFEVVEQNVLPQCKLTFVEDLATSKYMLSPIFKYKDVEFRPTDKSKQRVNIAFKEGSPVVTIYNRDVKREELLVAGLISQGLRYNNYRLNDDSDDQYSILTWYAKHKESISDDIYSVSPLTYRGDVVNTDSYKIEFTFSKGMDWFDLHGLIHVGNHQIIFADLLNNIAKGNRFYKLRDGTCFIIPALWMTKYGNIAKFAKIENGKAKLGTSQFVLLEELDENTNKSVTDYRVEAQDIDYTVSPLLKGKLRPYQYEGAKWLVSHHLNGHGALLADDMGLGKTIQTLSVLLYAKEILKGQPSSTHQQLSLFDTAYQTEFNPLRALIILPASLVFNWKEEINKFAPSLNIAIYMGVKRDNIDIGSFDIVLTTYQTAARDYEKLKRIEYSYIILDESHYIKNRSTKLFSNINQLKSSHKISLSGTPIENSLSDLYTQMEFINPDILGSYKFFKEHYQLPIEKHKNEEALEELNQILAPFIKRRTRDEVLGDLPELTEHIIYSEMTTGQKKLFDQEKAAARNFLLGIDEASGQYKIHVFNILLRLRKIANHPLLFDEESTIDSGKFDDVTAYLSTICKSDNKILVFSSFLSHIGLYEEYCTRSDIGFETLTGKTAIDQRKKSIHRFKTQADKKVFFISLKAGGVGLNLTEANYVIILDPWWNPFAEKQAIARAHRMGQENKVTVTRFISRDSIEEKILTLQQNKLRIAGDVIDLGEVPDLSSTSLAELLM